MTLSRDERESLQEELHDVARDAEDIRVQARLLLKRQPARTDIREVYAEKAAYLLDLADELEHAQPFASMRRRLAEDEQARGDQEEGQMRRAYFSGVL